MIRRLNDSDVLISYAGCGCAGGLETTILGELVPKDDGTGNARRKQKVYADILGRTYKTETYEWENGAVYSTVVNDFNQRDQVLRSRHFAGDDSSTTYQDTLAIFDGHGRLSASHRPEQRDGSNNPAYTTYTYNADDSIATVTDARGAVTHYTYENSGGTPKRPLVTGISWSVPQGSGISVPTSVSYSFDNAGNRIGMTDALGTVAYSYDELSRMTSEARNFSDTLADEPASGVYEVQYTYGLAGGLLSYTDPFGEEIGYSNDKLGRLSSVTGSTFGGVTSYIDGIQYRAWGGFKYASYGNNMESFLSYNDQLQPEGYLLRNSTNYSQKLFDREYEYQADGKLSLMEDNTSQSSYRYDRSFKFDHLGRVTKALSGVEATGGTETDLAKLPYRQSYTWNAFGNLEERESTLWNFPQGDWDFDHTVTNNRRQGTNYDNDGRVTQDNGIYFIFDAAGSMLTTWRYDAYHMTMTADGDGIEGKRFRKKWDTQENDWDEGDARYMIYSSVLGQIVSEANDTGKKYRTMVVGAGSTIARQGVDEDTSEMVGWEHRDPNGLSTRSFPVFGLWSHSKPTDIEEELDGLGNNVGAVANLAPPQRGNGSPYDNVTIMSPAEQMCMVAGMFGPCEVFDGFDDAAFDMLNRVGMPVGGRFRQRAYLEAFGRNNPLPTAIGPQMRRDRSPESINHEVLHATGMLDPLFQYRSPRNDMSHRFAAMNTPQRPDLVRDIVLKAIANVLDDPANNCARVLRWANLYGQVRDKLVSTNFVSVEQSGHKPAIDFAPEARKGETLRQFFYRTFEQWTQPLDSVSVSNEKAIISLNGAWNFVNWSGSLDTRGNEVKIGFTLHELVHHATGLGDDRLAELLLQPKAEGDNRSSSERLDEFFNGTRERPGCDFGLAAPPPLQ